MSRCLVIILVLICKGLFSQSISDSTQIMKEYNDINEALKTPENIYRLNLENQNVLIPKEAWAKFVNLEYLSLKNDHFKEIPSEIGLLKKLKCLDLSGNDFISLPKTFVGLNNLQKLILNDDPNLDLSKNIDILKGLKKLDFLSLKNDHFNEIPHELGQLRNLRILDLSGNDFTYLPSSISNLVNLEEIYLNDDINFNVEVGIDVISTIPNLKALHLENDNLTSLPPNLFRLVHLERLYLNNNNLKEIPLELKNIRNLKFVDLKENKFKPSLIKSFQEETYGTIFRF